MPTPIDVFTDLIRDMTDAGRDSHDIADAVISALDPILNEVDGRSPLMEDAPFTDGWHAAVFEIRDRLGLTS